MGYLGIVLILAGAALTVVGILSGEMQLGLVLFFIPFIHGSSLFSLIAIGCIILGIFLTFLGWSGPLEAENVARPGLPGETERTTQESRGNSRFGGVVLIGPIPIIIGSDRRMALWAAMLAAVLLTVLALLIFLR